MEPSNQIPELERLIRQGMQPQQAPTHTPALLLPDAHGGLSIHSIEKLQDGRARFRGSYSTTSTGDFTLYCGQRDSQPVVFIDPAAGSAVAFFNLGDEKTPGHGDDRGTLNLRPTSGFEAVSRASGHQFSQRQLADWLEDWADCVQPFYADEVRNTLPQAIAAVRSIEIKAGSQTSHEDRDFGAQRTALEQIEAKAKETTHQLPNGFIFTCQPYDGFESQAFRLRLSIHPSDPPKLILRVIALDDVRERIAEEFVGLVRDGLATHGRADARIYRGTFSP